VLRKVGLLAGLVKLEHTLFALPFALISAMVAADGIPEGRTLGWILVAMVGARTCAMAFNRLVDLELDRLNPRTRDRALPRGLVSVAETWVLVVVAGGLFILAAGMLNRLALSLAPAALVLILGYSYTKRFTTLSHLVLGLCLGIAPVGAWIAVRGEFALAPLVLAAGVMLWTAGFDVIYACQDYDFDRSAGLFSVPSRLGIPAALIVSGLLHAGVLVLLVWYGRLAGMVHWYWAGVGLVGVILIYEHSLVRPEDLSRVNQAFFTANGVLSVALLASVCMDVLLR